MIGFFEEYHDMLQGLKEKYSSMEYTDDCMKESYIRSKDNPEDYYKIYRKLIYCFVDIFFCSVPSPCYYFQKKI